MKITIRLIVALLIVIALVAVGFSFFQVRSEKIRLEKDMERRAAILAESLQESVKPLVQSKSFAKLSRLVERFGNRERLKGVAVYDVQGNVLALTPGLAPKIPQPLPLAVNSAAENKPADSLLTIDGKETYLYALPFLEEDTMIGTLVLIHDASFITIRLNEIWRYNLLRSLTLSVLIAVITLLVIRWSITGPIAQIATWMRQLRTEKGKIDQPVVASRGDVLAPLISEVTQLSKSLAMARARAEEAKLHLKGESLWTEQRLKEQMHAELGGKKLFLVSNQEPYMHVKEGRGTKCIVPAGGLVAALDPVMRACDGTWVAHGSGEADREVVDANDKLRVPPDQPSYTLKRIWLSREEEDGYYYGFSNEGMWPLCHITHTRPVFRLDDWRHYQQVNDKFAEARIALFLDFDGTLVPIQEDPAKCVLPSYIKRQLEELVVSGRCSIFILSGRSLSDIEKKVGVRGIYYGGNHGLVIAGPNIGYIHSGVISAKPIIDRIRRRLEMEIGDIEGAWIERKKFTFTLHYRTVKKEDLKSVKKIFYKAVSDFSGKLPLIVIKGKKVLELYPDLSWNKGTAALWLLDQLGNKCLPIYVGDDITDESVFKTLYEKGVTVKVGWSKKSAAKYYLKGQGEVAPLLQYVLDALNPAFRGGHS